jgi:hypothetical protein
VVTPKQLLVGRPTTVHLAIRNGVSGVAGVRVGVKGAGLSLITRKSNALGKITVRIKPKKAGIVTFKTVTASSGCRVSKRLGVAGGFTNLTG